MCNGETANNTINTCNGNSCGQDGGYADTHAARFPGQPLGWTEDWSWFTTWGGGGEEAGQVGARAGREVVVAAGALVEVPEDVDLDVVEAVRPGRGQQPVPVAERYPWRVEAAS